ncbi:MAG: hypothetical protein AAF573_22785 [Bacteroidota bacterium]
MNFSKYYLLIVVSIFINNYSFSQNCGSLIAEDKTIGSTHFLKSEDQTLVVRGNYTYSLQLINDEKGISAKFISKNGVDLNEGDEVIFMDTKKSRKSYRFVGMGEINTKRGTPIQTNTLELDLAAINWFATSPISTIYIRNYINNKMVKFTVTSNRQREFKSLATCFNNTIDKTKVDNKAMPNRNPSA